MSFVSGQGAADRFQRAYAAKRVAGSAMPIGDRRYTASRNCHLKGRKFAQKIDRQNEERAKAILFYIREHFSEDISISTIVQHVNISQSECFRCFKRFTHKTPVEYINEYRLANAAKMLMETTCTITEISSSSGFSNSSYFCKLFKGKYRISPAQYRKCLG